jgi:hypothetical protein
MARNQPFDFSDDEDIGITSRTASTDDADIAASGSSSSSRSSGMAESSDLSEMGDADLLGDTAAEQAGRQGRRSAKSQEAAQQIKTATRGSTGQHDPPTSMQNKRGNQPR